ncbi:MULTISPECIES: ribbon-helix-helix domain-containing protein [Nostocaceae]|uniref:ribbon-helix-helix domain-containing protein n=1 Tax=Nostocaceae TaxID=1162 RepID=UPI0039C61C98
MNVSLTPELEQFIQMQIASGKYASAEEVIVDALKMFATKGYTEAPVQVKTPDELGWPPGFFEQTAGCLQDDPLVRYPQGEYEVREPLE